LNTPALQVGGLTPLTTTDFPGYLAAVVFCQGCPWRCGYCHNPHLIPPDTSAQLGWAEVVAFLKRRTGLLDGVVFSGGEPTLQAGLADAIREVRKLGFRVGLHSASPYPKKLATILPWLDWVGFDVKAPFAEYEAITGVPGSGIKARAGLHALLESGVAYEVRTTVHSDLLGTEALLKIAADLRDLGVQNFILQEFRPQGCTNPGLCAGSSPLTDKLIAQIAPLFNRFEVRRA